MKPTHELDPLFNPKSIAIIGASNSFGKWGFEMTMAVSGSYGERKVYPVNEIASEVLGLKAYKNVKDVPGPVDLAVITVPPQVVPSVMKDCAEKGVKTAVIASAGLSETGQEGASLESDIVKNARSGGIRLMGPNSMGHFNLDAGFSTTPWLPKIKKGHVSIISQSGNSGVYALQLGSEMGIGFNKYISSGNEADLHAEDFLEYLAQDEGTKVILAYIEGFREGRRFLDLAREITKKKPIVILKAGRTEAGKNAARSHTAAISGSEAIHDAAFKQAGIISVEQIEELIDVAGALLRQPLPKGRRVGILTGGGGFGVLSSDACEKSGLEMSVLTDTTIKKLNKILPPRWSHGNPVDMAAEYMATFPCLWALMEDENVDALLLSSVAGTSFAVPQLHGLSPEMLTEIEQIVVDREKDDLKNWNSLIKRMDTIQKPVILLFAATDSMRTLGVFKMLRKNGILMYPSPARAVKTLAYLIEYSEYLRKSQNGN